MDLDTRFKTFLGQSPQIDPTAFVHPAATLIGDVRLGPRSSVWPGCVLRADINFIEIGEGSNVQDGSVLHLADDYPVRIGDYTTIGHLCMIHACDIGDTCLIGMHATVLDGAIIGSCSIVGAHSLVTKGTHIPPGSLVMGAPAKVVKTLSDSEQAALRQWAEKYIRVAAAHKATLPPCPPG